MRLGRAETAGQLPARNERILATVATSGRRICGGRDDFAVGPRQGMGQESCAFK